MSHNASSPFRSDDQYRQLRGRLIGFFSSRGCNFTADLADDTVGRLLETNTSRPADCSVEKWAFGIARNVWRESIRTSRRMVPLDPASPPAALQYELQPSRIDLAMLPLDDAERALLQEYIVEGQGARMLARRCGITEEGIRGRAHRVLRRLRRHLGAS